jgi:tol-pal system protein YbgF
MITNMNRLIFSLILMGTLLVQTGCLKTRAQLREGSDVYRPNAFSAPLPVYGNEVTGSSYAVDEMRTEIARLSGRIEELERGKSLDGRDDGGPALDILEIERRLSEVERTQIAILRSLRLVQERMPQRNPNEFLDQAREQIRSKQYREAEKNLNAFLDANKEGQFAEEATFLRGEAYFNLEEFRKAIVDYSKFTDDFKGSDWVPEALYKIGLSFAALGMTTDANAFYEELISQFPNSKEASLAKSKLNKSTN